MEVSQDVTKRRRWGGGRDDRREIVEMDAEMRMEVETWECHKKEVERKWKGGGAKYEEEITKLKKWRWVRMLRKGGGDEREIVEVNAKMRMEVETWECHEEKVESRWRKWREMAKRRMWRRWNFHLDSNREKKMLNKRCYWTNLGKYSKIRRSINKNE